MNATPVECMLIGGPLNGKRGPIYGNDHCVDLELYDDAGNVTSIERYALGDNPTPTFRYHVGSKCPCGLKTCVESWEPGCGLGTDERFAKAVEEHYPPSHCIDKCGSGEPCETARCPAPEFIAKPNVWKTGS